MELVVVAARLTHSFTHAFIHRLDMEMVVLKLLLIPAKLRWAHLCDECVILSLIFQILGQG